MQRAPRRGPECGAVSRRGLARGCVSRAFTPADLAAAATQAHADCRTVTRVVYVDVDGAGLLSARGGGAALASRARLAPHAAACNALLEWAPHTAPGAGVRVRVRQALAPHEELLLWPDEALAADADVPYLTPNNVDGLGLWLCPACGARFPHPNPLKAHLYLGCAAGEAAVPAHALWRRLAEALRDRPPRPATGASLAAVAEAWSLWRWLPGVGSAGPPHLCLYCGRCYSRRYGLKIHLRTHTGHKPLHCPHCARAFADPSNLNKHVRLHRRDARAPPAPPGPRRDTDTMCAALCTPE